MRSWTAFPQSDNNKRFGKQKRGFGLFLCCLRYLVLQSFAEDAPAQQREYE
jgi:hypothetical protein